MSSLFETQSQRKKYIKRIILWSVIIAGILALFIPILTTYGHSTISSVPSSAISAYADDEDTNSNGVQISGDTAKPTDLCSGKNDFGCLDGTDTFANGDTGANISDLILTVVNVFVFVSGAVAVLFIVIGGFRMITSQGDQTKYKAGLDTVRNGVIGLILVIASFFIVQVTVNILTGGSLLNNSPRTNSTQTTTSQTSTREPLPRLTIPE